MKGEEKKSLNCSVHELKRREHKRNACQKRDRKSKKKKSRVERREDRKGKANYPTFVAECRKRIIDHP